jgi:uncharacterized membrane protein YkvI
LTHELNYWLSLKLNSVQINVFSVIISQLLFYLCKYKNIRLFTFLYGSSGYFCLLILFVCLYNLFTAYSGHGDIEVRVRRRINSIFNFQKDSTVVL